MAYIDLSDPFRAIGAVDNKVVERLLRRFTKGLYLDNRNIADPIITPNYFETQQKGSFLHLSIQMIVSSVVSLSLRNGFDFYLWMNSDLKNNVMCYAYADR